MKTRKRLTLSKETLHTLNEGQLRVVTGGLTKEDMISGCSAGTPYCDKPKPPSPA